MNITSSNVKFNCCAKDKLTQLVFIPPRDLRITAFKQWFTHVKYCLNGANNILLSRNCNHPLVGKWEVERKSIRL